MDDVFGIVFIARKPARQIVSGVEIRQDSHFEEVVPALLYFVFRPFIPTFFRHVLSSRARSQFLKLRGAAQGRNKAELNPVLRNMKKIFFRHPWLCTAAFASLLAVCASAAHPFGTPKQSDVHSASIGDLQIPSEVAVVLTRSCLDCHSNHTVWPWYSYVAPVSWMVERDVHDGRNRLNFSKWGQYTFQQREKVFADIATVVKNHEMPLPQYVVIHRQARLSDAETDIVYGWARTERRRLRLAR